MMSADGEVSGTHDAFRSVRGRSAQKHSNYFAVYDRYLAPYRDKRPTVVEIGVQHGGSLLMWKSYFGDEVDLVGVDILPQCSRFAESNVRILVGDQSENAFLNEIIRKVGQADIVIDDGSHIPRHQIATFEALFYGLLRDGGVYICEDCHTSYWPRYGGGVRKRGTFIEYAKRLCDQINAWSVDTAALPIDRATRAISSISFHAGMVVIEKGRMDPPRRVEIGEVKIDLEETFKSGAMARLVLPLKRSPLVQRLVRTNPWLWRMMRKMLAAGSHRER